MKEVTEFVIDREIWLRGEGPGPSSLLRSKDGKMCCLGVYFKACEIEDEYLRDQDIPDSVRGTIPRWTIGLTGEHGAIIQRLLDDNDTGFIDDTEREARIINGFGKVGIKVTFKG